MAMSWGKQDNRTEWHASQRTTSGQIIDVVARVKSSKQRDTSCIAPTGPAPLTRSSCLLPAQPSKYINHRLLCTSANIHVCVYIYIANLLPVSGLVISDIKKSPKLLACLISTRYLNPWPIYYYFRFLKTNGRHIEILLPVSILAFSLSLAYYSALPCLILCKLEHRRRSYGVILILQDGGHSVAIGMH